MQKANTSNRKKKSLVEFLKLITIGAIVGFIIGFTSAILDHKGIEINVMSFTLWLSENIVYFQIALILILLPPVLFTIIQAHRHLKLTVPSDDETLEIYEEHLDRKLNRSISLNATATILHCMIFGFSVGGQNPQINISLILFVVILALNLVIDMHALKLLQLYYGKHFSIFSNQFEKEYLAACDESEKEIIYKSSYDTFVLMKNTFVGLLAIAILSKLFLDTGNFPIILIGVAWLVQTLSYICYCKKYTK